MAGARKMKDQFAQGRMQSFARVCDPCNLDLNFFMAFGDW